jgi:hypothetical protein
LNSEQNFCRELWIRVNMSGTFHDDWR